MEPWETMKQLVILSGKGGTGKTSLSAAFAHLAGTSRQSNGAVFADADVDAANLSLVLHPDRPSPHEFWGGSLAEIIPNNALDVGHVSQSAAMMRCSQIWITARFIGSTRWHAMAALPVYMPALRMQSG